MIGSASAVGTVDAASCDPLEPLRVINAEPVTALMNCRLNISVPPNQLAISLCELNSLYRFDSPKSHPLSASPSSLKHLHSCFIIVRSSDVMPVKSESGVAYLLPVRCGSGTS